MRYNVGLEALLYYATHKHSSDARKSVDFAADYVHQTMVYTINVPVRDNFQIISKYDETSLIYI